MQHSWTINSEGCYSYYCLLFLKIQFNGTHKKKTEPGNQRNSRYFLLMNLVALFLILEKKNQEFDFNIQSDNCALPTALCCTPLGGCRTGWELFAVLLNKSWACGKQFSPHLVMKGLDFNVKFGSFTWNLNHCTYYGDTCLNLECFCARNHLSTDMWLNICEVIKVALFSETEPSSFMFHIPQQQIFEVSALTNETNILCLERKKVFYLHLIKHNYLKLMYFIKITFHKKRQFFTFWKTEATVNDSGRLVWTTLEKRLWQEIKT